VPTDNSSLGETVKRPNRLHAGVHRRNGATKTEDEFERRLYILRKSISQAIYQAATAAWPLLPVSLSCRTVIYKGMFPPTSSASIIRFARSGFRERAGAGASALLHNNFPAWSLAHPYRMIAHNGEINTLRGNVNWMRRVSLGAFRAVRQGISRLWPIPMRASPDTACFDNALEFWCRAATRCRMPS